MNKYVVLNSDGQTSKVNADCVTIDEGALIFYNRFDDTNSVRGTRYENVIGYGAGCWKFFGLMDESGDVPNLEA